VRVFPYDERTEYDEKNEERKKSSAQVGEVILKSDEKI
jgi:hypothetical protein